jgi:hypothetical protein
MHVIAEITAFQQHADESACERKEKRKEPEIRPLA